jgi:hypothetical protein
VKNNYQLMMHARRSDYGQYWAVLAVLMTKGSASGVVHTRHLVLVQERDTDKV